MQPTAQFALRPPGPSVSAGRNKGCAGARLQINEPSIRPPGSVEAKEIECPAKNVPPARPHGGLGALHIVRLVG
jgi:hypothetical protein